MEGGSGEGCICSLKRAQEDEDTMESFEIHRTCSCIEDMIHFYFSKVVVHIVVCCACLLHFKFQCGIRIADAPTICGFQRLLKDQHLELHYGAIGEEGIASVSAVYFNLSSSQ